MGDLVAALDLRRRGSEEQEWSLMCQLVLTPPPSLHLFAHRGCSALPCTPFSSSESHIAQR